MTKTTKILQYLQKFLIGMSKMYIAIDAPFIEWGWPVIYYWFCQRNAIHRHHMRPLYMIPEPRMRLVNPGIIPSTNITTTATIASNLAVSLQGD
jgi:hypothetical protein